MTVERTTLQPATLGEFVRSALLDSRVVIGHKNSVDLKDWLGSDDRYEAYVTLVTTYARRPESENWKNLEYALELANAHKRAQDVGLIGVKISSARSRGKNLRRQWRNQLRQAS
jgi:hypothetical protein